MTPKQIYYENAAATIIKMGWKSARWRAITARTAHPLWQKHWN